MEYSYYYNVIDPIQLKMIKLQLYYLSQQIQINRSDVIYPCKESRPT